MRSLCPKPLGILLVHGYEHLGEPVWYPRVDVWKNLPNLVPIRMCALPPCWTEEDDVDGVKGRVRIGAEYESSSNSVLWG
jgi:hypothetical protein